jgi:hypothetical protein
MYRFFLLLIWISFFSCKGKKEVGLKAQFPSPMEENIRLHQRVDGSGFRGERMELVGIFAKNPVLLVDEKSNNDSINLLIHFHGHESMLAHAIDQNENWVGVAINLGGGSKAYSTPLLEKANFEALLSGIQANLDKPISGIYLSGFSAGYGAIRAILRTDHYDLIQGVLLLDGLHAAYIPESTPLSQGGKIKEDDLDVFLRLAEDAVSGNKKFVLTHSGIFPGTFVSTTESADFLLRAMGMGREPVLQAGPLGMQQVGQSIKGNFKVLAFAGNTAPDHIDHLHGLFHFIRLLEGEE